MKQARTALFTAAGVAVVVVLLVWRATRKPRAKLPMFDVVDGEFGIAGTDMRTPVSDIRIYLLERGVFMPDRPLTNAELCEMMEKIVRVRVKVSA